MPSQKGFAHFRSSVFLAYLHLTCLELPTGQPQARSTAFRQSTIYDDFVMLSFPTAQTLGP